MKYVEGSPMKKKARAARQVTFCVVVVVVFCCFLDVRLINFFLVCV